MKNEGLTILIAVAVFSVPTMVTVYPAIVLK